MTMDGLQERVRAVNTANGWRDTKPATPNDQIAVLALITTEVAEGIEEIRNGHDPAHAYTVDGKPEGVPSELADVVIRAFDAADVFGFDLAAHIDKKLTFNEGRGYRHGEKVA